MRAIRCYTAALLGIDPDLPLALINRGSLLEGQGQRAAAMADFKRVIEAQAKLLQASPSDGDALSTSIGSQETWQGLAPPRPGASETGALR